MTCVLVLVFSHLAICSNTCFQLLKHAIGDVFNVTTFKEGVKLVSILLNICRDLGVLGLVCIGLCKKQLLDKFLRSWNVERVAPEIFLRYIQEQLTTMTLEVTVRHHCWLLLFTKLTNDLIADVLEAYKTLEIQCDSVLKQSCCILLFVGVKMLGNNHTPCGKSIALHLHAPKFKALGLESRFSMFSRRKM